MVLDERSRHALQSRLEGVLGTEDAEILMAHLREIGSGDLVTVSHLDARLELFEERMARMEDRILKTVRADMNAQTKTLVFSLLAANATFAGLVFAAVEFV